ncbi:hypothetical protein [Mycolicibacterium sp. 018/SC-01/001]|uniref:hypothetical protein n=1 Tax=Mycolicibacterium sp. 018/SC-01/001 TaxID=2592069 RepID=UPI001C8FA486|nr:hypothetical protein [Mycolicibacterium sp. 018/SC-01/001]
MNSVLVRSFALNIPGWAWAAHGVRHPLGDDFGGFQDIVPQTFDEESALALADSAPTSLLKQYLLNGTPSDVIDQLAVWRDHGVRHPVLINASLLQQKLARGAASTLPFLQILRRIRSL